MIDPVQTRIPQADGSYRQVIIEPVLKKKDGQVLRPTGIYKIYKDAFHDETHLFTEPLEKDQRANELPDEENPDYLGKFIFKNGSVSRFEGEMLSVAEQAFLAVLIETYPEPDNYN